MRTGNPYDPGGYRRTDPSTSRDAAEGIDASRLENEFLAALKRYGPPYGPSMCVVEIWHRLPHLTIDTVSPRPVKLVEKGLIVCLGKERRISRYGKLKKQKVYSAAPEDIAAEKEARRTRHGAAGAEAAVEAVIDG
jgi:hypothetical protein